MSRMHVAMMPCFLQLNVSWEAAAEHRLFVFTTTLIGSFLPTGGGQVECRTDFPAKLHAQVYHSLESRKVQSDSTTPER